MYQPSELARVVTWFYHTARYGPKYDDCNEEYEADEIIWSANGAGDHPVGVELWEGKPHSKVARRIFFIARRLLNHTETAVACVETIGYTRLAVRSLLKNYDDLRRAELGSSAYCIALDLRGVVRAVPGGRDAMQYLQGSRPSGMTARKAGAVVARMVRMLEAEYDSGDSFRGDGLGGTVRRGDAGPEEGRSGVRRLRSAPQAKLVS